VDARGGEIRVKNNHENQGATIVKLPYRFTD
jgi:hypothetical protein